MAVMRHQPQGRVQIDWSNPITRGLVSLLWLGDQRPRDLVNPELAFQITGAGVVAPMIVKGGRAWGIDHSNADSSFGIQTARGQFGQAKVTKNATIMHVGGNHKVTAGASRCLFGVGDGFNGGYMVGSNYGKALGRFKTTTGSVARETLLFGAARITGMVLGADQYSIWLDGRSVHSAARSGDLVYDNTYGHIQAFGNVEGVPATGGFGQYGVAWSRDLSAEEMRSLASNPWQLFRAPESVLSLASAAPPPAHILGAVTSDQSNDSIGGAIVQPHALGAVASAQSNDSFGGSIAQAHALAGATSSQSNDSSGGAIAQSHVLAAGASDQSNDSVGGSISQTHALGVAPSDQSNDSVGGSVTQTHTLAVAISDQSNDSIGGGIGQAGDLATALSDQSNDSSGGAIVQTHVLASHISDQAQASIAGGVTQTHILISIESVQSNDSIGGSAVVDNPPTPHDLATFDSVQSNYSVSFGVDQAWRLKRVKTIVYGALAPILANTFAVELPPDPEFPACVFNVVSDPESGWSTAGAPVYTQHEVTVLVLGRDLDEIEEIQSAITSALESIPGYMSDEGSGDAAYEDDPDVYGLFQTVRIRTRIA